MVPKKTAVTEYYFSNFAGLHLAILLKQDITMAVFMNTFQTFRNLFLFNFSGRLFLRLLCVATMRGAKEMWPVQNYMLQTLVANNAFTIENHISTNQ